MPAPEVAATMKQRQQWEAAMNTGIDLGKSGSRLLATLYLVLASSVAHAVNLIDDGRIVTTFDDNGSSQTVPAVPFEPFNVS